MVGVTPNPVTAKYHSVFSQQFLNPNGFYHRYEQHACYAIIVTFIIT